MARKRKGRDISGWLVVDKPAGMTSTAVVNKVRWAMAAKKAGHAGTLDPEATGVLAVALGEATKTVPYITDSLKAYTFTVRLGAATNTDDAEGEVIATSEARPTDDDIKAALDLLGLRKLSFVGRVEAEGKKDWVLTAKLGATVVQPCVVTLEPVTTRIDVPVTRTFLADWADPEDEEFEIPEGDETEALGAEIDPTQVMIEALSLALPLYPRKEGAELEQADYTEPGKQAMTDEDAKPFAGLAGLRDALKKDE